MLRALAVSLALALAPLQCGGPPQEHPQYEDSPAEAVWTLAERFEAEGDERARRQTLEYLVERYPSSRFAERARSVLGQGAPAEP